MHYPRVPRPALALACLVLVLASACASGSRQNAQAVSGDGGLANPGQDPTASSAVDGSVPSAIELCATGKCRDFPEQAILDEDGTTKPPANAASYFGKAGEMTMPGVCVLEPPLSEGSRPGALFPRNWLRPRFRWTPLPGEDLWEVRLTASAEAYPLIAYTAVPRWSLPRRIWRGLSEHVLDAEITVTIRGVSTKTKGKPSGTRGTFMIAPVEARGKLVYWAMRAPDVRPDTSKLVGFDVGDESVTDALTIPEVGDRGVLANNGRDLRGMYDDPHGVAPGAAQCIGCHVSTPDGEAVAFTDHWPWNDLLASVEEATVGRRPKYLTSGAELLMNQPWLGMQTFSKAHWKTGDRVLIAAYSPRNQAMGDEPGSGFSDGAPYPSHGDRLAWFDLETKATFPADPAQGDVQKQRNDAIAAQRGQAFGFLRMDGETRSVAAPAWSHDGERIVYTSAEVTQDGRISGGNHEVDLHVVPYADRKGGTVMPVQGAAEPGVGEYYPALSADDSLIAFTRVAKLDDAPLYYRADGEIFVVPSAGGSAVRVLGNDPPACSGQASPGVINSWPKWSPAVSRIDPKSAEFGEKPRSFYWLVFSSARAYEGQFELPNNGYVQDTHASQLYLSAVVRDEKTGELSTYPAIYLWNQDPSTSNLTPAWDVFKIPEVPGPE